MTEEQHDNSLVRSRNVPAREKDLLLFQPSTDGFHSPLFVGELTRLELGVNEVAVDAELKAATARWDELQCTDLLLVSGQEPARQTDGLRLVVSHRTVLEFNLHILSLQLGFPAVSITLKLERFAVGCSRGHKPEAQAKDPRIPSLAPQACVHGYTWSQNALVRIHCYRTRPAWEFQVSGFGPDCGCACLYQPRILPRSLSGAHEKIPRNAPSYRCAVGRT